MGNFLSAIGRAQPATQIERYRTAITNRENESLRTEAYVQSQKMAAQRQQKELEIITNKQKQEQEAQKKLDHPVSWDVMSHRFEGGAESPMFKMTYELAKNNGLVASGAGLGTISVGNKQKLDELMKSPEFQTNMSKTRIDYWTNQVNSLAKVASGDPEAKKASNLSGKDLEEAQERAQLFLDKALSQDKAYIDGQKAITDKKKQEETVRHNKATEGKGSEKAFVTWQHPTDKKQTKNLRSGVTPPKGWVKYTKGTGGDGLSIAQERLEIAKKNADIQRENRAVDAEEKILGDPEDSRVSSSVRQFQQNAGTQPYMYIMMENENWYGGKKSKAMKIDLPSDPEGRQVTAKDIMDTLFENPKKFRTVDDVLRAIGVI